MNKVWLWAGAGAAVALVAGAIGVQAQVRPSTAVVARSPTAGIDWKAAMVGQRQSYNQSQSLPGRLGLDQAAVDKTAVPILLPTEGLSAARIYSFGDYYAISADQPGLGISLTGTTARVNLPAKAPMRVTPGDEDLVIQRTVDGQLASFVRFGVLYTVELRCDEPTDSRCKTDAAVRDLVAKTTVVVMGKAARQAAGMGG